MIQIVVAHYQEDLQWLHGLKKALLDAGLDDPHMNLYVYHKGGFVDGVRSFLQGIRKEDFSNIILTKLDNIGRESHTYLYHMLYNVVEARHRRDALPAATFFMQGRPSDHGINFCQHDRNIAMSFLGHHFECDNKGYPHHIGLPIIEFYHRYFTSDVSKPFVFTPGGQFSVNWDCVFLSEDRVRLLNTIYQDHWDVPMLPWILERLWLKVFTDDSIHPRFCELDKEIL